MELGSVPTIHAILNVQLQKRKKKKRKKVHKNASQFIFARTRIYLANWCCMEFLSDEKDFF